MHPDSGFWNGQNLKSVFVVGLASGFGLVCEAQLCVEYQTFRSLADKELVGTVWNCLELVHNYEPLITYKW